MASPLRVLYNCNNCPAYCCSYSLIEVKDRDVLRLARHFDLTPKEAERRFTKLVDGQRAMRHQKDEHYGTVCRFLDRETRRCTIYESRPAICRAFPSSKRCGYYDFLMFERGTQDDPEYVARAYNP